MMIVKRLVLSLIFVWTSEGLKDKPSKQGGDCVWNWNTDFPKFRPLILRSHSRILLPVEFGKKGNLASVENGDSLTFACSGFFTENNKEKRNFLEEFEQPAVKANCINGKIRVERHQDLYNIADMGCKGKIKTTTRALNLKCGGSNGNYQTAFETFNGTFVQIIEFCFDENKKSTIWSKHTIHGESLSAREKIPTTDFSDPGRIFNFPMDYIYRPENQKRFFIPIVGPNFIDRTTQRFFSRGHMAPKSDFVTVAEQVATYNYINVQPQWQPFNEKSWGNIETDIQSEAKSLGTDITIVTGGYNILQLGPQAKKIYLGNIEAHNPAAINKVLVPDFVWKAVIEKTTAISVVFVIVNNPLLAAKPLTPRLCQNFCNRIGWISQETKDMFSDRATGFTFCCTVEGFKESFPGIKFPTV